MITGEVGLPYTHHKTRGYFPLIGHKKGHKKEKGVKNGI